ncbi:MAG: hypothetical protein HY904_24155 [Deltaproteobacteria bacterium]|nr:hypothetical protein [Deltaproteobacteria bacterium]
MRVAVAGLLAVGLLTSSLAEAAPRKKVVACRNACEARKKKCLAKCKKKKGGCADSCNFNVGACKTGCEFQ